MAGLEIVGVVLASMPLVISAIEHYRDAFDPLKDYLKYHSALNLLRTHLNIEQTLFRETLESLLSDQLNPEQRRSLFPEGAHNVDITLWGTDEIQKKLQARLGSKFTNFTDLVGEMESVMKTLMKDLGVEPDWQGNSEIIASTIRKGDRERKKLKWSFGRKRREALLLRFEKCNQTLEKYVKQQEVPAPTQTSSSNQLAMYLQKVRDHACKVHDALEDSWKCRCSCSHVANLKLEHRSSEVMTPRFDVFLSSSDLSTNFHEPVQQWTETHVTVGETDIKIPVSMLDKEAHSMQSIDDPSSAGTKAHRSSFGSKLLQAVSTREQQAVKVEASQQAVIEAFCLQGSVSHNQPNQQAVHIQSLCEALKSQQRPSFISGILNDPSLQERIAITMISPAEPAFIETVSLVRLIAAKKSAPPHESPSKLSGRQRLSIAVTLAHTVLQLYDTPWLSESWSKDDISFLIPGHDGHKQPSVQRPYISRLFNHGPGRNIDKAEEGPCSRNDLYSHLITNKTLFALGIVLIELALERSFEELCTKVLTLDGRELSRQCSTVEIYQVATSLIDDVYNEQGTQYGYVVQRCLRCEFGFHDSKKRLEVNAFRAAVCEGVLAPLEEDLKRYSLPEE